MADNPLPISEIRSAMKKLWPVAKGSLSLVRKPCIHRSCKLCASGEKHPVWLFSFRQAGRRRCMYVTEKMVPVLRQAIENGRRLEALMADAGEALLTEAKKKA